MTSRTRYLAAAIATAAVLIGITAGPANAWPAPTLKGTATTCPTGSEPAPRVIKWTIVNHETAFPASPLYIEDVTITGSFPAPVFAPQPVPNTGTAKATAKTTIADTFTGNVTLTFTPHFKGADGEHKQEPVSVTVKVPACPVYTPPTTTTTTTSSTTTTTSVPAPVVAGVSLAEAPAAVPVPAQPAFTG